MSSSLKWLVALLLAAVAGVASAFEPFTVRDIRIIGVQRIEPGTVFGYLPVKVGDRMDANRAAASIRSLFGTGFFNDVRLDVQGDVLVVVVDERPAIASVEVSGSKEIEKDTLMRALRDLGLVESRTYDRALLERAEQELRRLYLSRSRYAARIVSTVTPLERNRVALTIDISEGETARIVQIRFVGNQYFSESELRDQITLTTPGWFTWYSKADRYSRERLAADLEALRSFYLNRGFLEFSIDSTQVSIGAEREDVFLTINITEGERYRVSGFRFSGETLGRDEELAQLFRFRPGARFSGERLTESTRNMTELFGRLGYAFASVNAIPELDREKREVSFNIAIDPGRRSYVRRINISGNARTRDEVIRRELRQYEGAWFDSSRIALSRDRLGRLGYFTTVDIDPVPVADAPDQVDLAVVVEEQPTGQFVVGVGVSSTDNFILSTSINQQNFLGTGRSLSLELNTGSTQRTLSLRTTNPYFTDEGISQTIDATYRELDARELGLGDYKLNTGVLGLRFGVPYTELSRVSFGMAYEQNALSLGPNSPNRYRGFVNDYGNSTYALLATLGWSRDTRDSALTPSRGSLLSASSEVTLPVGELRYARAQLVAQWYFPITRDFTFAVSGDLSRGESLEGRPYPIFKNYYAGGIGSVRGFEGSSLGAQDNDGNPVGGKARAVLNTELLFPMPGTGADRSIRMFVFFDVGNISEASLRSDEVRASSGLGINWLSPIGPLKLSLGYPVRRELGDRLQQFQFQIGTGF